MFDFCPKALLISLEIIFPFITLFYFYFPVRIPMKWVPAHLILCIFTGYLLTMMSRNAPEFYQVGIGAVVEIGWTLLCLLLCEGSICCNFIRYFLGTTIAQLGRKLVLQTVAPNIYEVCIGRDYHAFSEGEIIVADFLYMFFLLLFKPFVCWLTKDTYGRRRVYQVMAACITAEIVLEIVVRSLPFGAVERIHFRSLFTLFIGGVLLLTICIAYRKAKQWEHRQMDKQQELLSDAYQSLYLENQTLHYAKHEVMRHMRRVRSLEHYVPEQEWVAYAEQLRKEMGNVFIVPCTGNLYMDALILQQYNKAEAMGILLELVLEPISKREDKERQLITISAELFSYIMKKRKAGGYIRFSIRNRCGRHIVLIETDMTPSKYYRRKLIDQLGDKMVFRQAFSQTRYIAAQEDGGMFYQLEPQMLRIMVML